MLHGYPISVGVATPAAKKTANGEPRSSICRQVVEVRLLAIAPRFGSTLLHDPPRRVHILTVLVDPVREQPNTMPATSSPRGSTILSAISTMDTCLSSITSSNTAATTPASLPASCRRFRRRYGI